MDDQTTSAAGAQPADSTPAVTGNISIDSWAQLISQFDALIEKINETHAIMRAEITDTHKLVREALQ
jgi:hypothetical protein